MRRGGWRRVAATAAVAAAAAAAAMEDGWGEGGEFDVRKEFSLPLFFGRRATQGMLHLFLFFRWMPYLFITTYTVFFILTC
jgi:hypothetical protein